ncbi:uncharacterized protein LOC121419209 [Lytechinus variegatus]|uniref:uncharacterized protein LOC121419209 n=1 Tax=Lytechinus variegatus TaxID=7654 RepID=UPI001BB2734B|nr:uncharacterized protein LOC121419209 [Lytechinus variegatus]
MSSQDSETKTVNEAPNSINAVQPRNLTVDVNLTVSSPTCIDNKEGLNQTNEINSNYHRGMIKTNELQKSQHHARNTLKAIVSTGHEPEKEDGPRFFKSSNMPHPQEQQSQMLPATFMISAATNLTVSSLPKQQIPRLDNDESSDIRKQRPVMLNLPCDSKETVASSATLKNPAFTLNMDSPISIINHQSLPQCSVLESPLSPPIRPIRFVVPFSGDIHSPTDKSNRIPTSENESKTTGSHKRHKTSRDYHGLQTSCYSDASPVESPLTFVQPSLPELLFAVPMPSTGPSPTGVNRPSSYMQTENIAKSQSPPLAKVSSPSFLNPTPSDIFRKQSSYAQQTMIPGDITVNKSSVPPIHLSPKMTGPSSNVSPTTVLNFSTLRMSPPSLHVFPVNMDAPLKAFQFTPKDDRHLHPYNQSPTSPQNPLQSSLSGFPLTRPTSTISFQDPFPSSHMHITELSPNDHSADSSTMTALSHL